MGTEQNRSTEAIWSCRGLHNSACEAGTAEVEQNHNTQLEGFDQSEWP